MVITIFFGLIGFGIMVFVHELGHFVAARIVGITVEVFSLGWGSKMIGFQRGGTSYQISWFPIGGFCRMKGEDPWRREGGPPEAGSFFAASPGRRILVAAAGPFANIIFSILVLTLIWGIGFSIPSDGNRIIMASDYRLDAFPAATPAEKAGIQTGDRVLSVGGNPVENFQDLQERIAVAANQTLKVILEREGRRLEVTVVPELDRQTGAGKIGVYAWREAIVDRILPHGSAAVAGLRPGDRLLKANGAPVRNTIDFYQALQVKPAVVDLEVERGSSILQLTLVPNYLENGTLDAGMSFVQPVFRSQRVNLAGALGKGIEETASTMVLTVKGIGLLFKGVNLRNAVAGPLRITYYVGSAATSGFHLSFAHGIVSFFRFLCLLSVVLFIMNLLPIPAMDGGQIAIFLIELVRGRQVSPKVIYGAQVAGFSLIIILAVMITFSDILFFMGR